MRQLSSSSVFRQEVGQVLFKFTLLVFIRSKLNRLYLQFYFTILFIVVYRSTKRNTNSFPRKLQKESIQFSSKDVQEMEGFCNQMFPIYWNIVQNKF